MPGSSFCCGVWSSGCPPGSLEGFWRHISPGAGSRATISFALGINLLLFGAIGPFAAAAMDRFGARRTITLALAVTAASVVLTPAMSHPWQLVAVCFAVTVMAAGVRSTSGVLIVPLENEFHW